MRRLMRPVLLVVAAAGLFVSACADSTSRPKDGGAGGDGPHDLSRTDSAAMVDGRGDEDVAPDRGGGADQLVVPDRGAGSDVGGRDRGLAPDQGSMPAEGVVLFGSGAVAARYALQTVKIDGSDLAPVSAAPSTTIDFSRIDLAAAQGPVPIDHGHAVVSYLALANADPLWHVRDGGRSIIRFGDGTGSGLALIDGARFSLIDRDPAPTAFGATASELYAVALDPARRVLIAVKHDTQLMLYRLDGTTFSGGASSFDAAPVGGVARIEYTSLLATQNRVYFVARKSAASDVYGLYAAPLDGSARATEITVPALGGGAVTFVGRFGMALSADETTLAFAAGTSEQQKGIYVMRAGAAPRLVSNAILDYSDRESDFMDGRAPMLAVSEHGAYVAYRDYVQATATSRLFVAKADGSVVVEVSTLARFRAAVREFNNLLFADDDNLVFFAGTGSSSTDAYRFSASTQQLNNLTQTAAETSAPFGAGELKPEGGWLSVDKKMLWFTAPDGSLGRIWGVDLRTFAATELTAGTISVGTDGASVRDDFRARPGDDRVYFIGTTRPAATVLTDIFALDSSKTAGPLNLTQNSAAVKITALMPSPDGQWVAFIEDDAKLKAVSTAAGGTVQLAQGSNIGSYQWLPDGSGVAYADGASESTRRLYYVAVPSGSPVTIYDSVGYVAALGAQ